jgi:hypothetical protein
MWAVRHRRTDGAVRSAHHRCRRLDQGRRSGEVERNLSRRPGDHPGRPSRSSLNLRRRQAPQLRIAILHRRFSQPSRERRSPPSSRRRRLLLNPADAVGNRGLANLLEQSRHQALVDSIVKHGSRLMRR